METLELETFELLQQLPDEQTEYAYCAISCMYSCFSTGEIIGPCDVSVISR